MLITHNSRNRHREGYVLIAVLIVIVVLSLVAYRFTDSMTSEYRAGARTAEMAQARAAAVSGIHYTAALLADRESFYSILNGDPSNNASAFSDVLVRSDPNNPNKEARFAIISIVPVAPGSYEQRYGVIDEGSKLNINSMIALDKTGAALKNALMKLPNMSEDIADAIVDWVDADDIAGNPDTGGTTPGAESSYYSANATPYLAKNGPLNSLDELLLVQGVTPQLLFGTDRNRNGVADDGGTTLDRGWSDYLTVHGRELNVDSEGTLRIWINGTDPNAIYDALIPAVGDEMAAYIMAAKLIGTQRVETNADGIVAAKGGDANPVEFASIDQLIETVDTKLASGTTSGRAINSVITLMDTRVKLGTSSKPGSNGKDIAVDTVYNSPLNDPAMRADILARLMDKVTTKTEVELIPRVNVATASREVLLGLPGLTEEDVDAILSARDGLIPGEVESVSGAWLINSAGLTRQKFRGIEQYATSNSMVYRVESVGYVRGGPVVRIEAMIDTNMGAPRILYFRELTDLDSPRAYQPQR